MKYGVLDIGSNSVRLMISQDGITQYKCVKTTRLAENMGTDNVLQMAPIERTAQAVSFFVKKAQEEFAEKIYIFATAAVRQAENKAVFLSLVKQLTGYDVDVIDGIEEANLGAIGALNGNDGGVIDVGGASSEVLIIKDGKTIFTKSLDVGAVKIFNQCGQDSDKILSLTSDKAKQFESIPSSNFFGIGGTATTLASIDQKMKTYNPKLIHGHVLSIERVKQIRDMLLSMTLEEKFALDGLQKERAEVISGGVAMIYAILKKANANQITISESDNLEGYLLSKGKVNEKAEYN